MKCKTEEFSVKGEILRTRVEDSNGSGLGLLIIITIITMEEGGRGGGRGEEEEEEEERKMHRKPI